MSINKNVMLGMPTLIELNSLAENMILCKELNLDLLEINMNLPQFQLGELQNIDTNNVIAQKSVVFLFFFANKFAFQRKN